MPPVIGANDTVDNVTHVLHRLQVDGWGVRSVSVDFDYGEVGKQKVPVEAVVRVELVPTLG